MTPVVVEDEGELEAGTAFAKSQLEEHSGKADAVQESLDQAREGLRVAQQEDARLADLGLEPEDAPRVRTRRQIAEYEQSQTIYPNILETHHANMARFSMLLEDYQRRLKRLRTMKQMMASGEWDGEQVKPKKRRSKQPKSVLISTTDGARGETIEGNPHV